MKNLNNHPSKLLTCAALLLAVTSLGPRSARADVIEYFANGDAGRLLTTGSGRDGAFLNGPSQTGITVVGANISINTDVKSIYEFSSFTLGAGFTITAVGSAPLIIRVAGVTTLAGTFTLDGATGGPAVVAAPGAGASAGAGGGRGGSGGKEPPSSHDGENGFPRAGASIGGGVGPNDPALSGQREGGGGCNGPGATGGLLYPASAPVCPLGSTAIAGQFETAFFNPVPGQVAGGAGGGGGGTRDNIINGMNGAGGGGGGGALVVTSRGDVNFSGTVNARGGQGGAGNLGGGGDFGSSGGGGSGGSVWFQSVTAITGAGTVRVNGGPGGQDGTVSNVGGTGSRGVVRADLGSGTFSATVIPAGQADQIFTVYPVTVEFNLSGGPACGTITDPRKSTGENARTFIVNISLCLTLITGANVLLRKRRAY